MIFDIDNVQADIQAFADDDNDAIVERSGHIIFYRNGNCIECDLREGPDGNPLIDIAGEQLPYRRFISHKLARLDVFAEKLASKRPAPAVFIDGPGRLDSVSLENREDTAVNLLHAECSSSSAFAARVVFITADAGTGKTVLLKQYQAAQAQRFLSGQSPFIFWHIDLQGRQLLRLSEALMGDLGELRISGLWMASIVRLLRHRVIVLGIDGFDELAAEQGNADALGALSLMVSQLDDRGTIVAASRRTFFDTDEYVRRMGLIRRRVSESCEFDEIRLGAWGRAEGIKYLALIEQSGRRFENPELAYNEISDSFDGDETHPMLSRPFLLAQVAKGVLHFEVSPSEFVRGMKSDAGVAPIVTAFVEREVKQKWKSKDTGEPYLDEMQHMQLLGNIAEEMWRAQVDRIESDVVETVAAMLIDEWKIPQDRSPQIIQMARMHALLTVPADGNSRFRAFDHPEFRDYFVAHAIADRMTAALASNESSALSTLLSIAPLQDGIARYAASILAGRGNVFGFLSLLEGLVTQEWKPTFLQANVGTLVPFLLNHIEPTGGVIRFAGRVVYSSLVFENTRLRDVQLENGEFLNVSFADADWERVRFINCVFNEITVDLEAKYDDIRFESCKVGSVIAFRGEEETDREYAPDRVVQLLRRCGISIFANGQLTLPTVTEATHDRKLVERFLRLFRRSIGVSENTVVAKFRGDANRVSQHIIPLMIRYEMLESITWKGGGVQGRWALKKTVEEILRTEGSGLPMADFWREIDAGI